ncbi:MAG: macro domain-containing protein [Thermotogae bacterium]|jgi:putative ATPase|nr:macro domain-containing protein [Thermotogota bacterium]MCL5032577.1 macro domain-containing protein [Thermotogota bacterium]
MLKFEIGGTKIEVEKCDITKEKVETIVNAANSHLSHGGGVALAISRSGGPDIDKESRDYISKYGPVETGKVAVTSGGKLTAHFVIHAVGPIWGEGDEDRKLSAAFENALLKADEMKIKSIAFPAISSGIYGFPKDRCAKIFYETLNAYFSRHHSQINLVRMCLYSDEDLKIFESVFNSNQWV